MIPICGPFYKIKNGSWYYENPLLKLYVGDKLEIYFKINFSNITKRDKLLKHFVIPIGESPEIDTLEEVENNNEIYDQELKNFNIFKHVIWQCHAKTYMQNVMCNLL